MRLKLISCEVLFREMCAAVARSPHQVDVEFLPKALHDRGGDAMQKVLQEMIDQVDPARYQATLMGYGLCGNGLLGLTPRAVPVVAPRAHDCIALLMGSRRRYQEFFDENPGVYFRSTGWLERGEGLEPASSTRMGAGLAMEDLVARYGEENARYLFEELTRYRKNYRKLVYIETGLEADGSFEQRARAEAAERGWTFEKFDGSLSLFERLVAGDWNNDDFLVVNPGYRIVVRYDENVIDVERCGG